jgi:hypothetical protein
LRDIATAFLFHHGFSLERASHELGIVPTIVSTFRLHGVQAANDCEVSLCCVVARTSGGAVVYIWKEHRVAREGDPVLSGGEKRLFEGLGPPGAVGWIEFGPLSPQCPVPL